MKSIAFYLLNLVLLTALVSCGKDNESGKTNNWTSQYGYNPYTGQAYTVYPNTQSGYAYNSTYTQAILNENPCGGVAGSTYGQARIPVQFQLTGFRSYLQTGEIYAGVTSVGDVALVIGQGANAPLFVAYVCQRSSVSTGQGQLMDLALGTYSQCAFKQLTRATMVIPGAVEPLYFRMLEGRSSTGMKFSFCAI